jgi:hypothetical protein
MTDEIMTLRTLLEKSSDADFVARDDRGARSPERITHRNGYRDRLWETRASTVELRMQEGLVRRPDRSWRMRGDRKGRESGWARREGPLHAGAHGRVAGADGLRLVRSARTGL